MIIGPHYLDDVDMDEIDIGAIRDCLFDLDDLLDFPKDLEWEVSEEKCGNFHEGMPTSTAPLVNPQHIVSVSSSSNLPVIAPENIEQLECLSTLVKDFFSTGDGDVNNFSYENSKDSHLLFTGTPKSIIESCSCSSGEKTILPLQPGALIPKSARKKRTCVCLIGSSTFKPYNVVGCISSSPSVIKLPTLVFVPQVEYNSDSHPKKMTSFRQTNTDLSRNPWEKEQNSEILNCKRKMTEKIMSLPVAGQIVQPNESICKKCMHCERVETSKWRRGLSGPETLCNDCGIVYRKERLFPAYRPMANPTNNPLMHVFDHREITETRSKNRQKATELADIVVYTVPSKEPDSGVSRQKTGDFCEGNREGKIAEEAYGIFQEGLPIPNATSDGYSSIIHRNIKSNSGFPTTALEDFARLEKPLNFDKASSSEGNDDSTTVRNSNSITYRDSHQFYISSPTTVLGSSNSSSGRKTVMPLMPESLIPKFARKKRTHVCLMGPSTFNPRNVVSLISSSSAITKRSETPAPEFASQLMNTSVSPQKIRQMEWENMQTSETPGCRKKKKTESVFSPYAAQCDDFEQINWLSDLVDASIYATDEYIAVFENSDNKYNEDCHHLCTAIPTSVFESTSSSFGGNTFMPLEPEALIPESARKKRTQICLTGSSTLNPRNVISLISSSSPIAELCASDFAPQHENVSESRPRKMICFGQTKAYLYKNQFNTLSCKRKKKTQGVVKQRWSTEKYESRVKKVFRVLSEDGGPMVRKSLRNEARKAYICKKQSDPPSCKKEKKTQDVVEHRWSAEKYESGVKKVFEVLMKNGGPMMRNNLINEVRKSVRDTGLLGTLLKEMTGKLTPDGKARLLRRKINGYFEYWLQSRVLLRTRVGSSPIIGSI